MILHKYKRKTNNNKEYAHKCVICLKTFPKYCLLERHMRIHTGDKPFVVCKINNFKFHQQFFFFSALIATEVLLRRVL